jgi:nucleoside 2-deoxyribosyltransferase
VHKTKVYLAGAVSDVSHEEANTWRKKAKHLLDVFNIFSINPVDFYSANSDPLTHTDKEIMDFDLAACLASDIILVNLDFPDSIGTAIEAFFSYRIEKKPVIGFGNNLNVHPWLKECLSKRCSTMEEAIEYIASYYKQIFE